MLLIVNKVVLGKKWLQLASRFYLFIYLFFHFCLVASGLALFGIELGSVQGCSLRESNRLFGFMELVFNSSSCIWKVVSIAVVHLFQSVNQQFNHAFALVFCILSAACYIILGFVVVVIVVVVTINDLWECFFLKGRLNQWNGQWG